jgi:hypothetical protein
VTTPAEHRATPAGRFGTWPRQAGVLVAVSGALIAIGVIVSAVAARPPRHFPGQYAFSGQFFFPTSVSATQAFHDHGLVPPADIRNLRYSADSQAVSSPYPYPLDAVFVIPCAEVDGFVRENNLRYGPLWTSTSCYSRKTWDGIHQIIWPAGTTIAKSTSTSRK